jgi:hypothetical protein
MPRDISSGMLAPLLTNYIRPCLLAVITFASQTVYVWTGVGDLVYNGNTYLGVGGLGSIGKITEATDVQAYGLTLTLSGIDPNLLNESLIDIKQGAPAILYFALLDSTGAIYGTPYPMFSGNVDKSSVHLGVDSASISLQLENRLADLQRASNRRYTSADQQRYYPGDTIFSSVESLNDIALIWNA